MERRDSWLLMTTVVLLMVTPVGAETPEAPQVGEPYQEVIDKAWAKAMAGESPANTCAGIKGRTMHSMDDPVAQRALLACGLDIPVRYFDTVLDQVEAGEKTCIDYMTEMATQLTAMTISTDTLRKVAESLPEGDDAAAQEGAAEVLTSAAEEGMTEKGPDDPKRLIKDRLAERTRAICPEVASVVLR